MPFFLCSQDGEIDLKLLTKVLAPEHEVREVRGGSGPLLSRPSHSCASWLPGLTSASPGPDECGKSAVMGGKGLPSSHPAIPLLAGRRQLGLGPSVH